MSGVPPRLRIEVSGRPEPGLLRAAIAARLERRPFPPGPEDEVAARVVAALREPRDRRADGAPWR